MLEISKEQICNLSRLPLSIEQNPCYLTALQLISDKQLNFKDTALYNHYKEYSPKTLHDMYGIVDKLKDFSSESSFLPWIHTEPVERYPDPAFINRGDKFIKKQVSKILSLVDSIGEKGFVPEQFLDRKGGNITGYFLKSGDKLRWYVVSGNHRAAVVSAARPEIMIPVAYEKKKFAKKRDLENRDVDFLKQYDLDNAKEWPSVRAGFLTQHEARSLAERYFYE